MSEHRKKTDWVSITIVGVVAAAIGYLASENAENIPGLGAGSSSPAASGEMVVIDTEAYVQALTEGETNISPDEALSLLQEEAQRMADEEGRVVIRAEAIWAAPEGSRVHLEP